ncbi:MAG: hypothetical protein ABR568_00920 [Pyrinomonadaceae bacterium]
MYRIKHCSILLIFVLIAQGAFAGTMARLGGGGGTRTVTLDCGSNAFIVGVTGFAGKDGPIGFNVIRKVRFTCQAFNGTTPVGATSQTAEAAGTKQATTEISIGGGNCPAGQVITHMSVLAGVYIDRIVSLACEGATGGTPSVKVNVGGFGGSPATGVCPDNEALYKVDVRVGDVVDSLTGSCRPFFITPSITEQFNSTVTPRPSRSNPIRIPAGGNEILFFGVTNAVANPETNLGISVETGLLSGTLGSPEFKMELLNPSNQVVVFRTFTRTGTGLSSVRFGINANGTWRLRVTNLERNASLNVTDFNAFQ